MTRRSTTTHIAVHCSATAPTQDIGVTEIDASHKARGWSGVGYHCIIRRDGAVEFGRHPDDIGAHVRGYNSVSIGVCLIGGVDEAGTPEDNFTPEQFDSLALALRFYRVAYPAAVIQGHRDFYGDTNQDGVVDSRDWLKECPCFEVEDFVATRGI